MIEIKNLNLTIKNKHILSNINMSLSDGKAYGFVGNNGCGKTMLMKCICGLIKPSSGEVIVDGRRVGKDDDFIRDAGIIIETPGFITFYSGFQNLKFLADIKGKIDDETIRETMRKCGLDPALRLSYRKYRLGMKQRLGISQAIMEDPKYLILDEPMNGLDKKGVADVREILLEMKKKEKTLIISSHNQADIDYLCDGVFEIDAGEIVEYR
ncbi:MAG: ATP-binding cassette domain-containing protein [Lachnospiraceae bacterium]|nr:ATP-binding cassette domain-containing protein [Lachnospiraceae bacterium]